MKIRHLWSTKPTSHHPSTHTQNSSLASHSSYSKDPSLMRSNPQRLAPNSFSSLTARSPFLVSSVFRAAATLAFLWFLRASHILSPLLLTPFFYILTPRNFKSPNRSEKFSHFPCLFTHSFIQCLFIHLFDKLSAYFLPGTVPGSRNKMESELGHHSCLPATYSLSREVINQIDLTDVRV